jgi:hypothetical protein
MRPFILVSIFLINGIGSGFSQVELPYFTGFDNDSQTAGWQDYRLGAESEFYLWATSSASPFSAPNSLNHTYPVGGSEQTEDWYVSPAFNLPEGGKIDSLRYAFSGFGVPQEGDTVAIYVLTGSQDPALATSQTLLMDFRDEDYSSDNTWRVLTDVEIPPSAEESFIAFRYSTVVNWLDVRFDNLRVSSNTDISVNETDSELDLSIYPNPSARLISVENKMFQIEGKMVRVFDLSSRELVTQQLINGKIDISQLPAGTYILEVEVDAGTLHKQFVKN